MDDYRFHHYTSWLLDTVELSIILRFLILLLHPPRNAFENAGDEAWS